MASATRFPLHIVEPKGDASLGNFVGGRVTDLTAAIREFGGILFRGFEVREPVDFQALVDAIGAKPMNYTYKSTPRTHIHRDIFTATEYPPHLEIPLHCENAYQRNWPLLLSLCCLVPATGGGGQTPIADMRTVTAAIERGVLDRFEERGVRYLRHYRLHVDLQWEDVFQTNDRDQLARFCSENDIHHEWLDDETLRTEQICQGVAAHPVTGEKVFFNQAHLFHVSSLGEKLAADMIGVFGRDRLPRDAKFGDGQEIETEDLAAIRAAFNSAAVDWDWRPGDVVVLDNMRFAHGRRSYSGKRRVLAALLNPYRAEDARRIS